MKLEGDFLNNLFRIYQQGFSAQYSGFCSMNEGTRGIVIAGTRWDASQFQDTPKNNVWLPQYSRKYLYTWVERVSVKVVSYPRTGNEGLGDSLSFWWHRQIEL